MSARRVSALDATEPELGDAPFSGLIELGKLSALIGDGGGGKTRITEQIAAGLATGKLWGETLPRAYRVLLINLEDDERDVKQSVIEAAGVPDPDVFFAVPYGPIRRADVEALMDDTGAEVVIINPFSDCFQPTNENDNSEVRRLLVPFKRLCLERRVAVLVVHHTVKGRAGQGGRNRGRGGGALFDSCALYAELVVTRTDTSWTLRFDKRRGGPRRKPMALRSNGTHFVPTVGAGTDTPAEPLEREIVRVLRERSDRWVPAVEIVKALAGRLAKKSAVYAALAEMRNRADVGFTENGRRMSYRYQPGDGECT